MGQPPFRQGALSRSQGHDRPRARPARPADDLGLAEILLSQLPTITRSSLPPAGHVYARAISKWGICDWVGPGYLNTDYDPYSAEARAIYWRQIKERLAVLGIDAWWMDAPEPDMHSNLSIEERKAIMTPTALGPGAAFFNSYPAGACRRRLSQGWRAFKPDTRSFILTRSAFGGLQRAGAAVWSGDVAARWDDLRNQISAGVNFSMSGIPNWTHDIGGFAVEDRYSKQDPRRARRMARAQSALVPVRRLLAALPQPRRIPAPRDLRDRPGGLGHVPVDGILRPAPLPAAALHLHARGRHLVRRRHDHARPRHGLPRRSHGAQHQRRISVRPRFAGRAGDDVQGAHAPRLSAGGDGLVRFLQRPRL